MSAELLPTGRDPLRRLWTMTLTTGVLGLAAIIYAMVNFARGRTGGDDWMFVGLGACLLVVALLSSIVHGVLHSYGARIAALEKQAAADATRPAVGSPS